jgi:hypothetical protein
MFLSNDAYFFFSLFKQGLIYVKNGLNHLLIGLTLEATQTLGTLVHFTL